MLAFYHPHIFAEKIRFFLKETEWTRQIPELQPWSSGEQPLQGTIWKKTIGDNLGKKRSAEELLILQDHHPLGSRTVHPDRWGFTILVQHRHTKMVIG